MKQRIAAEMPAVDLTDQRGVGGDAARVSPGHAVSEMQTASGGDVGMLSPEATLSALVDKLQQAVSRMKAGGEIPCHFTTLTTAIYHWQDLAKILEKYDVAVTQPPAWAVRSFRTFGAQVVGGETSCLEISRCCSMVHRLQDGTVLQTRFEV